MLLQVLVSILVILLSLFLYKKGYRNKEHFTHYAIKELKDYFFFGNFFEAFKMGMVEYTKKVHLIHPGEKAVGLLAMRNPVIVLRDTELIKQLAVKEFDHFTDHGAFIDDTVEPLFGNSVFLMKGQRWKEMRSTLSPAFTSSKMKLMYKLIIEIAEQMTEFLKNNSTDSIVDYDLKELCSRVTSDIIAYCAFGVKLDSLTDRDNDFYIAGQKTLEFTEPKNSWKFFLFQFWPQILRLFKIRFFDQKSHDFFNKTVVEMLKYREENNISRPDLINIFVEHRKGTLKYLEDEKHESDGFAAVKESEMGKQAVKRVWTDTEIISQCYTFFFAGFGSSSALLSFGIYELAVNPDVQEKLYEEIKQVHDNLNGSPLPYDVILKMKYMDMFVSETLRLWPPIPSTDRECVKELNFDDGNGFKYTFEKKSSIWIPICGFHADPKHFPNPEKFDPERFSDENKDKWNHEAFMPFGIGPRACIGSRFALMESKIVLYYLILNFSVHVVEKTLVPMKLKKGMGGPIPERDIWVGLKRRQ